MGYWVFLVSAIPAAVLAQATVGGGLTNFPDTPKGEPFTETV